MAQPPGARPSFEVASVKLAPGGCPSFESPGKMSQCNSLAGYIQIAYNLSAFGSKRRPGRRLQILGGPGWIMTDRYQITANAAGDAPPDQMHGPMMQVLLENRFKLKIRREAREMPVYILTVAKGGLRLKALKEGSCTPPDLNLPPVESNDCGDWKYSTNANTAGGQNITMDSRGESMADFAADLSNMGSDRVVIDKTGLSGLFNIHLEYARDKPAGAPGNLPSSVEAAGPSIFSAVQEQLGLRLSVGKGAVEVLIVDHIERPSAN